MTAVSRSIGGFVSMSSAAVERHCRWLLWEFTVVGSMAQAQLASKPSLPLLVIKFMLHSSRASLLHSV